MRAEARVAGVVHAHTSNACSCSSKNGARLNGVPTLSGSDEVMRSEENRGGIDRARSIVSRV